jgi:hypothetical protein
LRVITQDEFVILTTRLPHLSIFEGLQFVPDTLPNAPNTARPLESRGIRLPLAGFQLTLTSANKDTGDCQQGLAPFWRR